MAIEPLTAAITGDGSVSATLTEHSYLTAAVNSSGNIVANIIRNKLALTANIVTSATVGAELYGIVRSTKQVAEVLYQETTPTIKLRSTKQVVEVLYQETTPTIKLRSTKQVVEVLYTILLQEFTADIVGSVGVNANLDYAQWDYFTAAITISGNLSAKLKGLLVSASIITSATVGATLTGIRQFTADIDASGLVSASFIQLAKFTAAITCSGNITANIRENIEYLTADIVTSGNISANLNVPWHAGNTLRLQQTATAQIVLAYSISQTLNLTHQLDLKFGQRSLRASNTINFTHEASTLRVLPTKTASNTLNLTHLLSDHRAVKSFLVLRQSASGTIFYFEGITSNTLNLSDSASAAGTIFNLSVGSQLELTQVADSDHIDLENITSNLNLLQNAFAVILASKKYILLQAPFELIQTSVVLPNPLLDDNENLVSSLILRRSMNNVPRTYVKTLKNRRLRYTFTLDRGKALELKAFFNAYNGANIKMQNWKGEVWKVKLMTNPIDYVLTRRYEPHSDRTDVNLEFEGELLYG